MKGISNCKNCGIEFSWIRSKKQKLPLFCSLKCKGHTGFRPGGTFRTSEETTEEKLNRMKKNLEKYQEKKLGCWGWKGNIEKNGYARMSVRDIPARHGHVASYLINIGKIPDDLQVNHMCHNRSCTNPDHLYLGTQKENMNDKIRANRQAKGEKNGNSKLTREQVIQIKKELEKNVPISLLCEIYKVSDTQIGNIKNKKQWSHLEIE